MKWEGRRPKAAVGAVAALGVLIGLVLLVVLPALATTPGAPIPPPSIPKGITAVDVPTGGQSNDCAVFYANNAANQPAYQYRISNPKSQKYTTTVNGTTVTFTLTMNPPNPGPSGPLPAYANDKYVSFTSTGAAIADVGIKGGTDTARYNYSGQSGVTGNPNYGAVTSDGYLHAPAQSTVSSTNLTPTSLYSISNLTFCFSLAGSVSGSVYQDANQNGTKDTGDTGQSGWTVSLYKGVTQGTPGGGTLVSTTTSGSDGSYSFVLPFSTNTTYRLCEAPPSGTWGQSQPLPSTANICTGTDEPKGYDFQPTSALEQITGKNFGNVSGVACVTGPFGPSNYQIQLETCKTNTFIFNTTPGVIDGNTSTPPPTVSVWVADETQGAVPLVEKIVFPFLIQPPGTPQPLLTLYYDDTFPFSQADAQPMPFCKLDPRDGSEFTLQSGLPSSDVLPGSATSCIIQATQSATRLSEPDQGTYTAYVYSSLDGLRWASP